MIILYLIINVPEEDESLKYVLNHEDWTKAWKPLAPYDIMIVLLAYTVILPFIKPTNTLL